MPCSIFSSSFCQRSNMFIFSLFHSMLCSWSVQHSFWDCEEDRRERTFQFAGQALLFSERSTPECNALISGREERTLWSIILTTFFEEKNWAILRKSDFLFEDAALDTDQRLLTGEEKWIYTLEGDKYYLPKSKRHYPLAFFQSVIILVGPKAFHSSFDDD